MKTSAFQLEPRHEWSSAINGAYIAKALQYHSVGKLNKRSPNGSEMKMRGAANMTVEKVAKQMSS